MFWGKQGFWLLRFLGFEAKLVPGNVGGFGFGLGRGDGGGLGFGGDVGGNKRGEAFLAVEEKEQLAPVEKATEIAHGVEPEVPVALEVATEVAEEEKSAEAINGGGGLVVLYLTVAMSASEIDEKDVVVLGGSNFTDLVNNNKFVLVEFYAPWCGHCQTLAPEYAKETTILKDDGVVLAKVDDLYLVVSDFGEAVVLADVDEVEDVFLEAGATEADTGIEEFRANAGVFPDGVGDFIHVRAGGLTEGGHGVDGGDALCEEGVGRELGELRRLVFGGDDTVFRDSVGIDGVESRDGFLAFRSGTVVDEDATEHADLGQQFQVRGFPTILWFVDGKHKPPAGGRKAEEIIAWVAKKSSPSLPTVKFVTDAEKVLEVETLIAVAYVESREDKNTKVFAAVANKEEGVVFYMTDDKEVVAKFGLGAKMLSLVLLKKQVEKEATFDEAAFDEEAVSSFVLKNKLPLVITFNCESEFTKQFLLFAGTEEYEKVNFKYMLFEKHVLIDVVFSED
jgi:thiol-disulfide isomerase/thioredoxin